MKARSNKYTESWLQWAVHDSRLIGPVGVLTLASTQSRQVSNTTGVRVDLTFSIRDVPKNETPHALRCYIVCEAQGQLAFHCP